VFHIKREKETVLCVLVMWGRVCMDFLYLHLFDCYWSTIGDVREGSDEEHSI